MTRAALLSIALLGALRAETPSLTGGMHVARSGHQATLLVDGRVLVTGGADERGLAIGAVEISAEGQLLLRFGRGDATQAPPDSARPRRSRWSVERPSDVAVDRNGNVFVADAGQRPRIIKFDPKGRFLAATTGTGRRPGELDAPHSIAADASGNVYVADSGNARIQVFDNALNFRAVYDYIGTPWRICISNGSRQYIYSASNPDRRERSRTMGEIYKLDLDGTILGKAVGDETSAFFQPPDHIHCRDANTIVGLGERMFHRFTFAR